MKEIVILRHIGGRLGNQLWLYSNIYAYCLEKGYKCLNPTFYAYGKYYNLKDNNLLLKLFEFLSIPLISETHSGSYITYTIYRYLSYLIPIFKKGVLVNVGMNERVYLPPTKDKVLRRRRIIERMESGKNNRIYLDRGEFYNPAGVKKYRRQIIKKFTPTKTIIDKVNNFIKNLKNNYLIAVHIRQGDYKRFKGGKLYFTQAEIAKILRYFLRKNKEMQRNIKFILFSDSSIDPRIFTGLNYTLGFGPHHPVEDMLAMSRCKMILGSLSSFSTYAAYYGNIPLYIFSRSGRIKLYKFKR